MSKIFYFIKNKSDINEAERQTIEAITSRLVPDNISKDKVEHTRTIKDRLAFVIINDMGTFPRSNNSILCGKANIKDDEWRKPGGPVPDGDFAIFRDSDTHFEIVSNSVGSRTVWYVLNDEYFIASTSQRAIIMMLGSFEFNSSVVPWILSTGSLGPTFSWDVRISRLLPSSNFILNKSAWIADLTYTSVKFETENTKSSAKSSLAAEIESSIKSLDGDLDRWILPLSGGYDSRAILCYMSRSYSSLNSLRTLTWGTKSEKDRKGGDAYVARELAEKIGVKYEYLHTDLTDGPVGEMLERFLLCSEGRIDHLAGYADGLDIWKRLFDSGIKGVIRGDEGFGWIPVTSEASVRIRVGCALCSDFENLKNLQVRYGMPSQALPVELDRKDDETLEQWRDRLYHVFRIPTVLSALSDIKYSYIEQVNPLIYDNIISVVRTIPDEFRENKSLFREIVEELSPDVGYASISSNTPLNDLLSFPRVSVHIRDYLEKNKRKGILPEEFIESVLNQTSRGGFAEATKSNQLGIASEIKRNLPSRWKSFLRDTVAKPKVDPYLLAFRSYVIIKMNEIMHEDSCMLNID